MATTRPFAYNPSQTPISGATQIGDLAIGYPSVGFTNSGLQWWNGPDEELGYVVCKPIPLDNQPTPVLGDNLFLSTTYKAVDIALSNNNQTATQIFSYQQSVLGQTLISDGDKVMFSVKFTSTNPNVGVGGRFIGVGLTAMDYSGNPFGGYPGGGDERSIGLSDFGQLYFSTGVENTAPQILSGTSLPTWTNDDVIDVAIDYDLSQLWIRVNGGLWNNYSGSNPASSSVGVDISSFTVTNSSAPGYYPVLCPYIYGKMEILNIPKYGYPSGYNFLGKTTASVGFLRSSDLTEISFVNLVNSKFSQSFSNGLDSKNWLESNGYWSSFTPDPLPVGAFVMNWDTSYGDGQPTITLPLVGTGNFNFSVNWGDGNTDTITGGGGLIYGYSSHTYITGGQYLVYISGTIEGWSFEQGGDGPKLTSISQWGDLILGSNSYHFAGCSNLDLSFVSDVLNLNGVTNLSGIFANCGSLTGINNINSWDVSGITNMSSMFDSSTFNQDISSWSVSSVTDMSYMFYGSQFNQDISGWTVSNVTNMSTMFGSTPFNQDISSWNVSGVTNMSSMFALSVFNQDISSWNVSSVTDMSYMFYGSQFQQDISGWTVSNVTDMSYMFASATFNQDISSWNITNVSDMSGFMNDKISYSYYDDILNSWSMMSTGWPPITTLYNGVTLDMGTIQYTAAGADARQDIIDNYSWTINDGGLV